MRLFVMTVLAMTLTVLVAAPVSAGPNDIAVIIANQNYKAESDIDDVPYAHRDGEAFLKAAVDVLGVPNIPVRNVLVVKDAPLTKMRELFAQPEAEGGPITGMIRDKKARIFVYYSGHGVPVPTADGGFAPVLLPVGVQAHQARINGFALDEIRSALLKMRQRFAPEGEVFLILDACFSGRSAAGEILKGASAGMIPASLSPKPGIIEIAAAQGDQVAWWDRDRKHGVFTDTFVDALYTADSPDRGGNGDGALSLGEIESFVQERISARLRSLGDGRSQRPVFPLMPSFVVASVGTPPPVRDPVQLHMEATRCKLLEDAKDPEAIDTFLGSCRTCTSVCTAKLTERSQVLKTAIHARESACIADRKIWDDVKAGEIDTIRRFAANASCDVVKAEADRWISDHDARIEAEKVRLKAASDAIEREAAKERERDQALKDAESQAMDARCIAERRQLSRLMARPIQGPFTKNDTLRLYRQATCADVKAETERFLRQKGWI